MMQTRAVALVLSTALLGAVPVGSALAQGCADQIAQLAQQYGLSADAPQSRDRDVPPSALSPPATLESRGVTETERTAQSSGVVTPPDTGAPVATVPPSGSSAPPSAPRAPDAAAGSLGAGERQRMEDLLAAARAAERKGDDAQCREQVGAAAAVPGVPGARRPQ
jgi:hypothetical protein